MINMCYWLSFFNPHFFVSLNSRTTLQVLHPIQKCNKSREKSLNRCNVFFLNKGIDFIVQLVLQILICVFTSKNNTNKKYFIKVDVIEEFGIYRTIKRVNLPNISMIC